MKREIDDFGIRDSDCDVDTHRYTRIPTRP